MTGRRTSPARGPSRLARGKQGASAGFRPFVQGLQSKRLDIRSVKRARNLVIKFFASGILTNLAL